MRFKYYLRGCGLGILLTAVILTIGFHRNGTKEMSDAQVIQRAIELGMVMDTTQDQTEEDGQSVTGTETEDGVAVNGDSGKSDSGKTDSEKTDSEKTNSEKTDSEKINSEKTDSEKTDSEKTNSEKTDSEKTDSEKTNSGKTDSEKTNSEKNNPEKNDSGKSDSEKSEKIIFTIKRGEYCRAIAENLYDLGLVDDAEAFRKYMSDNDYDNLIQVGTFELTIGMDYKEIAKTIINKDKRVPASH